MSALPYRSGLRFQPTLPARGATAHLLMVDAESSFQPTLPARGATLGRESVRAFRLHFNPRSPHGERPQSRRRRPAVSRFQPTLPARGATAEYLSAIAHRSISTHAPRTGSDERPQPADAHGSHFNPRSPHGERRGVPERHRAPLNFNPRSPHGERLSIASTRPTIVIFQPTLPARGATICQLYIVTVGNISTHAPRTGSDPQTKRKGKKSKQHFNPRSPHGERPRQRV